MEYKIIWLADQPEIKDRAAQWYVAVEDGRIIGGMGVIENDHFAGWLRFNLFWDEIPFMNMLYLSEEYRGQGYGGRLVTFWEKEMKDNGYGMVLTSTLSSEQAQFFYRKNGYVDCGSLLLPGEDLEIILRKKLD